MVAGRAAGFLARLSRPRFPGTAGERRAARLIRAELEAAGLEVREEAFSFGRADRWLRRLLGGVGVAGLAGALWLAESRPAASAAVLVALLAASLLSGRLWLAVARHLPSGGPLQSRNLIAALPGASPGLYLCAHYDSKSQALPLVARLGLQLALAALLAALTGLLLLGAAGTLPAASLEGVLESLFALAALGTLTLAWQPEGDRSPGALDNGAAVALLVALAPEVAAGRLEAGLIFFGAEELGLLGSLDYGRRHPEARGQHFVNLDGVGLAGRLRLFGGQGELGRSLREAARRSGVALSSSPLWPGLLMDHVALRRSGLAAASLGCVGGASLRIHSASDTPALVEAEGLREAAALLLSLAEGPNPSPAAV